MTSARGSVAAASDASARVPGRRDSTHSTALPELSGLEELPRNSIKERLVKTSRPSTRERELAENYARHRATLTARTWEGTFDAQKLKSSWLTNTQRLKEDLASIDARLQALHDSRDQRTKRASYRLEAHMAASREIRRRAAATIAEREASYRSELWHKYETQLDEQIERILEADLPCESSATRKKLILMRERVVARRINSLVARKRATEWTVDKVMREEVDKLAAKQLRKRNAASSHAYSGHASSQAPGAAVAAGSASAYAASLGAGAAPTPGMTVPTVLTPILPAAAPPTSASATRKSTASGSSTAAPSAAASPASLPSRLPSVVEPASVTASAATSNLAAQ